MIRPEEAGVAAGAPVLERFLLTDAADTRVSTYSGGMRRWLDLGASPTGRPPVILLDEPTNGLDPRTRQELWSTVEEMRRAGTTVLLTTQYLEEADRLAQRIAAIDALSDPERLAGLDIARLGPQAGRLGASRRVQG